jgi:diaminopimelate decarboxylase
LDERLVTFLAEYRDEFKKELPELDLGGGYGIAYVEGDVTVVPRDRCRRMLTRSKALRSS